MFLLGRCLLRGLWAMLVDILGREKEIEEERVGN